MHITKSAMGHFPSASIRATAPRHAANNLPGGTFYTSLSHDVVAHEVTHALLDGLRSNFTIPTGPDVPAFHEALADLVAFFQRFSYAGVVRAAIRETGNNLARSRTLINIAEQFGQTTSGQSALRTVAEIPVHGEPLRHYGQDTEPHKRGSVLTAAVFDAFNTVFQRKIQPYISLATNGTGVLPLGQLPADLQELLAKSASTLASQFLSILIRSIDYCPPVDIRFGDFLRALITADRDLVPDDPHAYREAFIDAFRRRSIFPLSVPNLSEDALVWSPPTGMDPIAGLNFANLRFRGDPQNAAGAKELTRQGAMSGRRDLPPRSRPEFRTPFRCRGRSQSCTGGVAVYPVNPIQQAYWARRTGGFRSGCGNHTAPDDAAPGAEHAVFGRRDGDTRATRRGAVRDFEIGGEREPDQRPGGVR